MKFPLPADTFPRVHLSEDDNAAIEQLAQAVVDDTLQQYHEHLHVRKGEVDIDHWKLVKKKGEVAVYKERHASNVLPSASEPGGLAGRAAEMPRVLTVGKLQGDLDDVMYSTENHTSDQMRVKAAFTENGMVDCANLVTVVKPSLEEPMRSVTIKWQVKGRPLITRPFVRFRDTLYIESVGIATASNGERIGYQLNHSVEIPGVRDLSNLGIVRANVSLCCLYRQMDNGVVDLFMTGFLDPLGDISPSLAIASLAEVTVSVWRNVLWSQVKKLTWMLSDMPPSKVENQEQASVSKCTVCGKGFGPVSSKTKCALCCGRVCSGCRVRKKLSLISGETGEVEQKPVPVCSRCMHHVSKMSAMDVAAHEVECEDLYPSEAASVWHSSPMSPSSHPESRSDMKSSSFEDSITSSSISTSSFRSDGSAGYSIGRRSRPSWQC